TIPYLGRREPLAGWMPGQTLDQEPFADVDFFFEALIGDVPEADFAFSSAREQPRLRGVQRESEDVASLVAGVECKTRRSVARPPAANLAIPVAGYQQGFICRKCAGIDSARMARLGRHKQFTRRRPPTHSTVKVNRQDGPVLEEPRVFRECLLGS